MTTDVRTTARSDAHRDAVTALESAFTGMMTQFRSFYVQAAQAVAPGMLPATYKVLSTLVRGGRPLTVSGLAELLAADKGQISRNVSELEELGLVERTPDPDDGRIRLIAVTSLGRERAAAARQPYQERLEAVLDDWSVTSIEQLAELLQALTAGITPRS